MKISYDNTIDDVVAFAHYNHAHSPTVRQARAAITFAVALLIVAVMTGIGSPDHVAISFGIGLGLAVVYVLTAPRMRRRQTERQIRRIYAEGSNKGILGPHELELTASHLIDRTPYHEGVTQVEALEKVVIAGEYTFIYVSALTAHVVPRKAVTAGDYEQFTEAIARQVAEANASSRS
jgi:hypothetical protein